MDIVSGKADGQQVFMEGKYRAARRGLRGVRRRPSLSFEAKAPHEEVGAVKLAYAHDEPNVRHRPVKGIAVHAEGIARSKPDHDAA